MEQDEDKLGGKFDDLVFELQDKTGKQILYMGKKALAKKSVIQAFVNEVRASGASTSGFTQLVKQITKIGTTAGREKKFKQLASKMPRDALYRFAQRAGGVRELIARVQKNDTIKNVSARKDDRKPENYVGSERQRLVQKIGGQQVR